MPTPNFHDLPDGSSSVNHTGGDFWVESDYMDEMFFTAGPTSAVPPPPLNLSSPPPNPVGYSSEFPPHPSYADGSAPLMTATQVNEARRQANPEWRPIPRSRVEDYVPPAPAPAPAPPPPQTAAEMLREASERFTTVVSEDSPIHPTQTARRRRANRRGSRDPDAAIRKDPNAWSLREAVELCKLLEVVVPEAGFHIALTGGLLYKEGRRKDCDLMFYQIRGAEPKYEILWKYLSVAGVIRSPSYPDNGWLVKATYRGKAVDCLFPNAKKKKVVMGDLCSKQNAYQASPPTPPVPEIAAPSERPIPILYHRSPSAPCPYDPAELLATPAPAPVPPPTIDAAVAASRIVESAASAFVSPPPDFVPSSEERARDLGISVRAYEMRFE